jgi:hypothetical protein
MEEEEAKAERRSNPEDGGGDGCGVSLFRALTAGVDELHPEKSEDEDVKADPVTDGGGARHLFWMLQRGRVRCTGGSLLAG